MDENVNENGGVTEIYSELPFSFSSSCPFPFGPALPL